MNKRHSAFGIIEIIVATGLISMILTALGINMAYTQRSVKDTLTQTEVTTVTQNCLDMFRNLRDSNGWIFFCNRLNEIGEQDKVSEVVFNGEVICPAVNDWTYTVEFFQANGQGNACTNEQAQVKVTVNYQDFHNNDQTDSLSQDFTCHPNTEVCSNTTYVAPTPTPTGTCAKTTITSMPTTMQGFTVTACNSLTPCTVDDASCDNNGSTVTLTDTRDGKSYKVRRFADCKCWMIDNLRYGGTGTDGCAGKTTFNGCGNGVQALNCNNTGASYYGTWTSGSATSTNSLYGSCRDASAGAASSSPCYGNTNCGYYYNWQAVMQTSNAYYLGTANLTPGNNGAGICPTGWHPPTSGSATAEFGALDKAMGGDGTNRTDTSGNTTVLKNLNFYTTSNKFNGSACAGICSQDGNIVSQIAYNCFLWSQTGSSNSDAYALSFFSQVINTYTGVHKFNGLSVRCVKD